MQLAFLQKSNEEQMTKLFELWRREPLAIHHYLQRAVFPEHMRSQHQKISASGQSVGGDMLFWPARRLLGHAVRPAAARARQVPVRDGRRRSKAFTRAPHCSASRADISARVASANTRARSNARAKTLRLFLP